jgi:mono/diheme cytochrome c family protein
MMLLVRIYVAAVLMLVCLSSFASHAAGSNARTAAQLYRRYCVSCHGNDGRAKTSKGKFSHARDLTDQVWQSEVSDERIFNSIMNGRNVRGNMPAFDNKLNEKEVDSLVDFVRRLKSSQQQVLIRCFPKGAGIFFD